MGSKVAQKLIALALMTLALVVSNELFSERFVRAAAPVTASIGEPAPGFALKDTNGKVWRLKDLKGKVIVLEWFNHGCPFVKKHYDSGNMPALQSEYMKKGVVWLCVCSSAPGKQGNASPAEHNKTFLTKKSKPSAILLDESGKIGKAYGAKATPHMFIINEKGDLVYAGAIDSKSGVDAKEIKEAHNYVKAALDEVLDGKQVSNAETKAYGCSIKFQ